MGRKLHPQFRAGVLKSIFHKISLPANGLGPLPEVHIARQKERLPWVLGNHGCAIHIHGDKQLACMLYVLVCIACTELSPHLRYARYCSKIETKSTCADVCSAPCLYCRTIVTAALAECILAKTKKHAMARPVRPRPAWQCTAIFRPSVVATNSITCRWWNSTGVMHGGAAHGEHGMMEHPKSRITCTMHIQLSAC